MIETNVFESLRPFGLTQALMPAVMTAVTTVAPAGAESTLMRVTEVQREGVTLHDGCSENSARLLPAVRAALADEGDAVAVGDWVLADRNAYGEWWVHTRVPPLNQLARRLHDGRDKVTRVVIVSNVDTALLVMGLDHDFSLRRLERYLALVRMAGVAAVVVLTKADLCDNVAGRLQEVQSLLPQGAAAVAVNALGIGDEAPGQALAPWLQPGQTLVLLGSSGAGKSTLTNALTAALPGMGQDTGPNRAGDSRGRHTTTARSLHAIPQGACIIDTPGLRTLRLDGDADRLDAVFDDIARLAPLCRFRDCGHGDEPGCAVRPAVSSERLRNYHKLLREAQRDSITALERKALVSQWKARGRAARVRMNAKRG
ncbi:MAG TPA: ribosome small subunit-dependent GTPase A [Rubrivivax sp.]|nr:ribosome small subunit-dependent GTPase A [Rubrivivax sp.]